MADIDVYALRQEFQAQGMMICFNGPFSHSVIEELGVAVKKYLASAEAPRDRIADVFSVFVEQAQNLKNYTSRNDIKLPERSEARNGTLAIARNDDHYIVSSGNLVEKEHAQELLDRLDGIVALDPDELKRLYKQRLRSDLPPNAGPGLGFITMARKASEPPSYSVRETQEAASFFSIQVVI